MKQNDIEKICDKIDSLTEVLVDDGFKTFIKGINKKNLLKLKEFIHNIDKDIISIECKEEYRVLVHKEGTPIWELIKIKELTKSKLFLLIDSNRKFIKNENNGFLYFSITDPYINHDNKILIIDAVQFKDDI
jgi:hypothetical protein